MQTLKTLQIIRQKLFHRYISPRMVAAGDLNPGGFETMAGNDFLTS
jgi:hypothetical protein